VLYALIGNTHMRLAEKAASAVCALTSLQEVATAATGLLRAKAERELRSRLFRPPIQHSFPPCGRPKAMMAVTAQSGCELLPESAWTIWIRPRALPHLRTCNSHESPHTRRKIQLRCVLQNSKDEELYGKFTQRRARSPISMTGEMASA